MQAPFLHTRRIIRGAASKLPTRVPTDSMWQILIYRGGEQQLATAGRSRNKKNLPHSVMSNGGSLVLVPPRNGSKVVGVIRGIFRRTIKNGAGLVLR